VPITAGITGNEEADEEAKRSLEESITNDESTHQRTGGDGWIKTEMAGSQQRNWEEGEITMKEKIKRTRVGKITLRS
jgi:hypothetical protein